MKQATHDMLLWLAGIGGAIVVVGLLIDLIALLSFGIGREPMLVVGGVLLLVFALVAIRSQLGSR